jgi:hypothetical protein
MGVTGCGETMEAAWNDMWQLYGEFIRESHARMFAAQLNPPRAG